MKNEIKIQKNQEGFSLLELLTVAIVIVILTTVSLFYLTAQKKLYNADEQSLKIIDIIQEARQRSLTQREFMRVEIDLTTNSARLIDENGTGAVNDDIIREIEFYPSALVRLDARPTNVSTAPPEPLPIPEAEFRGSLHPLSAGNEVATFRFKLDGTVHNAGTDANGSNSVPTGFTLYIWKPNDDSTEQSSLVRAITILGATGSVRMWDYADDGTGNRYWKDSRRATYGGAGGAGSPVR